MLEAGTRLGPWRLGHELGRGGMAAVYAAVHAAFGEQVAIKVAHRSLLGPQYTPEMFLREARVASRVAHPGVVQMLSSGTHGERPYILMERLSGATLGKKLAAGAMPRVESIDILLELCDILRATHKAGVVHRDLKLDNVLVVDVPYDGDRRVKLLDWGVAYVADEPDPFSGLIAGTLTYVAPEQIRGEVLTGACDVYSLAVIAFQLLCGRAPFAASSDLQLVHMHLRAEPPRPRTAWAQAPEALDELLHAMLAKRPEERPSLDEVVRVLEDTREEIAPIRKPRLLTVAERPPVDVLCRAALPLPVPFRAAWISLAITLAAFASLISALP
jgi:serine/threonine protein kinase